MKSPIDSQAHLKVYPKVATGPASQGVAQKKGNTMRVFTDRFLAGVKPQQRRYQINEPGGLVVVVHPTGRKVFYAIFRRGGKLKKKRIGDVGQISLAEARAICREIAAAEPAYPSVCEPARTVLVEELAADYLRRYARPRKLTWKEDERVLTKYVLPVIGHMPATDVKRRHIHAVLDPLIDAGTLRMAGCVLSIVRKMFNWALERDSYGLEYNPASHITNPDPGRRLSRHLADSEITTFWKWLDTHPRLEPTTIDALRMLLITGQRPQTVLLMTDDQIDGNWWHIPAENMKMRRPHIVYLPGMALDVIERCYARGTRNLFPVCEPRTLARAVKRGLNGARHPLVLPTFTPRDLRRTVATHLGEMGYHDQQIALILGHEKETITGTVYNRAVQWGLRQEMMERWCEKLVKLTTRG